MSIVKTTHVHRPIGITGSGSGAAVPAITGRCLISLRTDCQCGTTGWYCMEHGHWHWVGDLGD